MLRFKDGTGRPIYLGPLARDSVNVAAKAVIEIDTTQGKVRMAGSGERGEICCMDWTDPRLVLGRRSFAKPECSKKITCAARTDSASQDVLYISMKEWYL